MVLPTPLTTTRRGRFGKPSARLPLPSSLPSPTAPGFLLLFPLPRAFPTSRSRTTGAAARSTTDGVDVKKRHELSPGRAGALSRRCPEPRPSPSREGEREKRQEGRFEARTETPHRLLKKKTTFSTNGRFTKHLHPRDPSHLSSVRRRGRSIYRQGQARPRPAPLKGRSLGHAPRRRLSPAGQAGPPACRSSPSPTPNRPPLPPKTKPVREGARLALGETAKEGSQAKVGGA